MSKYTTEVRYICQSFSDTGDNLETTINKAIPHIFENYSYMDDKEHEHELEAKILRHYYTREIGFETVGLWKLNLNRTLLEIMPRYNLFYNNLKQIKDKIFNTVDFTESTTGKNANVGNSTSVTDSTLHSESDNTTHAVSDTTGKNTGSSTTSANGTSDNHGNTENNSNDSSTAWTEYNDTPQGSLQNLDSGTYLTNATKNKSNSEGNSSSKTNSNSTSTSKQDSSDTEDTKTNTDSTTTIHGTGDNTNKDTNKTNSSSNVTYESLRTVTGKNSGAAYMKEYIELMNNYNDVDIMVINDLEPLFMGLWE